MTGIIYSYDALMKHCEILKESNKYSKAKAGGWLTACRRLLTGLLPDENEDIRKVDIFAAESKYKASSGAKEKTAREYRNRVQSAISEFISHVDETANTESEKSTVQEKISADVEEPGKTEDPPSKKPKRNSKSSSPAVNNISVQIRPDFLAQLILPLDLKAAEAKHLCNLIKVLPIDYEE